MSANLLTLLLQSLAALAVVLALFAGLVWLLRQMQQRLPATSTGSQRLRVVDRCAIDARHSVVEVEAGGRRWLVGISPEGLATLGNYEASAVAPPAGAMQTTANSETDSRDTS